MAVKTITLDGLGDVRILKRKGQSTVRISISEHKVTITQPSWLPFSVGENYAAEKRSWIEEHLKPKVVHYDGESIAPRLDLRLLSTYKDKLRSVSGSSSLIVYVPSSMNPDSDEVQSYIESSLTKLLRNRAEDYLPARVKQLAEMKGFNYKSVSVRVLKRRWGSCNNKKELVFNINLIRLDPLHVDYVILHELTHTLHMNHGPEFWLHLESVFPGAKKVAKVVRRYQV